MKYSKIEIEKKALKLLNDIEWVYDIEEGLNAHFKEKREISKGENKGETKPCWVISLGTGKFLFGENRPAFITILDETGEPLYIQHSQAIIEIEKDSDGNYKKKE